MLKRIFCTSALIIVFLFIYSFKSNIRTSLRNKVYEFFDNRVLYPSSYGWEEVEEGVSKYRFNSPFLQYTLVKLDLDSSIDIKTFDAVGDSFKDSSSVKDFSRENGCIVSINTTPFWLENKLNLRSRVKTAGLVIKNQEVLKYVKYGTSCAAFFKEEDGYRCYLYDYSGQATEQSRLPDYAMGGFYIILDHNQEQLMDYKQWTRFTFKHDYRSAIGISKDHRTVYLFTGSFLNYQECSKILKHFGVYKALALDGGSSSSLVLQDKEMLPMLIRRNVSNILGFTKEGSLE